MNSNAEIAALREAREEALEHVKRAARGFAEWDLTQKYACAVWHGEDSDGCGSCLPCLKHEITEAERVLAGGNHD